MKIGRNNAVGIVIMCSVILFLKDINFPIPKELIKEAIGQSIIFFCGLFMAFGGFVTPKKSTATGEKVE